MLKDTGTELIGEIDGVEVLRYVYLPEMPAYESPKPYLHPVRTLAGDVVTAYRPHDHRWHKGIQMTASHLSGENFWGGGTYIHDIPGYADLPNNGTIRHRAFTVLEPNRFTEQLDWHTQAGEHWISEERTLALTHVDSQAWLLDFASTLENVRGQELSFGSPTSHGRPLAGYSGIFWRGPRAFADGQVMAAGAEPGEDMMGKRAAWLAYTGHHDEVDRSATLVFLSKPDTSWFVRTTPFPAVNPSLAFHEDVVVPQGGSLHTSCRILIADGALRRQQVQSYMDGLA